MKSTERKVIFYVIVTLFVVMFSVWLKNYLEDKKESDLIDAQIRLVTDNMICAQIGSIGMFGHKKGPKGAKLCQIYLDNRKFYKNDRVKISAYKNLSDCTARIAAWLFDPETMTPSYELTDVVCFGKDREDTKIPEENLESFRN